MRKSISGRGSEVMNTVTCTINLIFHGKSRNKKVRSGSELIAIMYQNAYIEKDVWVQTAYTDNWLNDCIYHSSLVPQHIDYDYKYTYVCHFQPNDLKRQLRN